MTNRIGGCVIETLQGLGYEGERLKGSPAAAPALPRWVKCAPVAQAAQATAAAALNANQHAAAAAAAGDCCNAAGAHCPPSTAPSSAALSQPSRTYTPPRGPPPPPSPPSPCAAQPAGRAARYQASGRQALGASTIAPGLGEGSRHATGLQHRLPTGAVQRGGVQGCRPLCRVGAAAA